MMNRQQWSQTDMHIVCSQLHLFTHKITLCFIMCLGLIDHFIDQTEWWHGGVNAIDCMVSCSQRRGKACHAGPPEDPKDQQGDRSAEETVLRVVLPAWWELGGEDVHAAGQGVKRRTSGFVLAVFIIWVSHASENTGMCEWKGATLAFVCPVLSGCQRINYRIQERSLHSLTSSILPGLLICPLKS